MRVGHGEPQHRPAAHGLRHQVGRLDLQVVQQPPQVVHERVGSRPVGDIVRMAEPAMVEGDAPVPLREEGYLLPPAQQVAAGAVGENDGLALAVALIVQVNSVDLRAAHVTPLLNVDMG